PDRRWTAIASGSRMATRISSGSPAANRPCGSSRKCGISFLKRLRPLEADNLYRTSSVGPLGETRMAESTPVRKRPLEGVRVIDLTKIVAGPNATRMLATMGAEVIRVEWHDQRALDLLRTIRPRVPGGEPDSVNRSGLFNNLNAGKYGITLK